MATFRYEMGSVLSDWIDQCTGNYTRKADTNNFRSDQIYQAVPNL